MEKWKSFSQWTTNEVEETFLLAPHRDHPVLTDWLINIADNLPEKESAWLDKLKEQLIDDVAYWNEEELRVKFIAPLLNRVNFDQPAYKSFYERELKTIYDSQELSGTVDFIVAQGRGRPQMPYFFIQEHKREVDSPNDPRGQLLVAMLVAQTINHQAHPVYGAYIMGRAWYFVILKDKEYAVSLAYDATKDEIYQIYNILQQTKQIINKLVQGVNHPVKT